MDSERCVQSQRSPSISWEVANGSSTKVLHEKTNARGWEVSMFDPELFRTTLATGPINSNNVTEEADEVMKQLLMLVMQRCRGKVHAIGILQCTGGITT